MRGLIVLVSLVALTGAAFAGEPQKSTSQHIVPSVQKRAPQKMTDQQLQSIVAGTTGTGELAMMNHDLNMSTANIHCVSVNAINGFQGWERHATAISGPGAFPAAMATPQRVSNAFC